MGLSLAFSCSTLLNAILLFRGLIRERQIKFDREEVAFLIRIVVATGAMAMLLMIFNPELPVWFEHECLLL